MLCINTVKKTIWFYRFVLLTVCASQAFFIGFYSWWTSYQQSTFSQMPLTLFKENHTDCLSQRSVKLFVAILTHFKRRERRDAIRETWMNVCNDNPQQIICIFFTDTVGLQADAKIALINERSHNKDIVILNATESFAFAERLLLIWEWSKSKHINYEFFLRIDDDHFLCVDRVLHELQHRPKNGLYWGFVHCKPRVVRVDEAWLMLSKSIIDEIMSKRANQSLLCSPYGDQAVAMWINECGHNVTYFMDNTRIVHKSAGENPSFLNMDICETYLSLHGAYPRAMKQFWLLSQVIRKNSLRKIKYSIPPILSFEELCPYSPKFEYKAFIPEYQFEPKLCHLNPKWTISKTRHGGREEHGERYTSY